jgi:predicted phage-related endonuclease
MIEIIDCEQNSPEWLQARAGIPTASAFSDVLAKGEGKTRRTYMLKLAGEIITGQPMESYSNAHTERGHALEEEARDLYAFQSGADLQRVGFIKNGRSGCSPDSLIGEDGGLEIKTKLPHLLIETILADKFPPEHKAQVQGTLWVTGRKWWDLAVYWPGIPLFVKRVERDDGYIANLAGAVVAFNEELDQVVKTIRSYGGVNTLLDDLKASAA